MNQTPDTLFRIAGLLACLAAGLFQAVMLWYAGPHAIPYAFLPAFQGLLSGALEGASPAVLESASRIALGVLSLGTVAFAMAFWAATRPRRRPRPAGAFLLVVQAVLGLVLQPDLLYIVAVELPFVFPTRTALLWLAAQMMVLAATRGLPVADDIALWCTIPGVQPPPSGITDGLALLGASAWQVFAFVIGDIAVAERRRRAELAGSHAELVATQGLLADSSRALERLRIARDLHDGLGHHLTALTLHLDLAARQAKDKAAEPIRTARDIARQLLVEVRTAVGAQRTGQPLDLRQALQTLCSGIPFPRVDLAFDERLEVSNPALAHAVFRCVQESISNAIRHADASAIAVALAADGGGLSVSVSDNGRGSRDLRPGNGLRGMRERVEEYGGRMEIAAGTGCTIRIWLPQEGRGQ